LAVKTTKNNQNRKKNTMAKTNYIQTNDNAFSAQLKTFKVEIPNYSGALGVTAAQVTAQAADCDYLEYVLKCLGIMQNAGQQWTAWKDIMRDGGTPPPTGAPVAPVFPAVVPAVAPGIEVRFRALVKQIKANPNYNVAIGDALGIEGAQQTPPDFASVQPEIDAEVAGNQVAVDWGWQGYSAYLDMCELQVDRGDGKGFVLLAFDTTPGYTDTTPLPATPAKWTYRAIYHVGDGSVGVWSKPATVTVPK
jgi:hypothetical protein